jgi:hypothetical protein
MRVVPALSVLGGLLGSACGTPGPDVPGAIETLPADSERDMALEFDGSNDYASLGTAGFPFPRLPQTISFWLSASAGGPVEQTVVTLNKDAASGILIGLSSGVLTARSVYDGDLFVQAQAPLGFDSWHHVAYLFDGSDDAPHHTLYLDGAPVGTGTALPDKRTPNTAFMGSDSHEERCFKGKLDELRIWAAGRTRAQLAEEIAGEVAEQEFPELVLYYSFGETDGARVVDRSGRGNHALLGDGLPSYMPRRVPSGVAQARR